MDSNQDSDYIAIFISLISGCKILGAKFQNLKSLNGGEWIFRLNLDSNAVCVFWKYCHLWLEVHLTLPCQVSYDS